MKSQKRAILKNEAQIRRKVLLIKIVRWKKLMLATLILKLNMSKTDAYLSILKSN